MAKRKTRREKNSGREKRETKDFERLTEEKRKRLNDCK